MHIARLVWIVLEYLANLADGAVDAVLGIDKKLIAPDLLGNLLAGRKLAFLLDQNEQDLQGSALEL